MPGKEKDLFFKRVEEQLSEMSEAQKDEWILIQARLLDDEEQEDFLKSLSGRKKILYMPETEEIEAFCRRVENGEIVLEYETHYYEFDDDGRYMDDWKTWYNDPDGAMPFLDRVFGGCHELLTHGEYEMAAGILDRVCRLRRLDAQADTQHLDIQHPDPQNPDMRPPAAQFPEAKRAKTHGRQPGG